MSPRNVVSLALCAAVLAACAGDPTAPIIPDTQPPVTVGTKTDASGGGTSMEMQTGNSTQVGEGLFSTDIQVRVFAGQDPAPGVTVNFEVKSGGGSVSPLSVVSDADGWAVTTLTYPANVENVVDATGPNDLRTRTMIATYVSYFGLIRGVGTGLISGPAGKALPDPLVVEVVDRDGKPLPAQQLHFEALEGGSLSATDVVTDANGRASVVWTLRATHGLNRVKVTGTDLVPHYAHAVGN